MNDPSIDELADEIGRLQLTDPMPDPDPAALTARGRRGLRRRRAAGLLGGAGLIAAAVVAVNLTAGAISNSKPPVLTTPSVAPVTIDPKAPPSIPPAPRPTGTPVHVPAGELLTPMPGVPAGDAALGQLTREEGTRRCNLRDQDGRKLANVIPAGIRGGNSLPYFGTDPTGTSQEDPTGCLIPGDSKPTEAGLAALRSDPVPSDLADRLRNCSVLLWHDVRSWRVLTSDETPGRAVSLQLLSPSGRHVADCKLKHRKPKAGVDMAIWPAPGRAEDPLKFIGHTAWCISMYGSHCQGYVLQENGRVSPEVARIEFISGGETHVVRPRQGRYSVAWELPDRELLRQGVRMYDAAGKVLYQRKGPVSPVDPSRTGG